VTDAKGPAARATFSPDVAHRGLQRTWARYRQPVNPAAGWRTTPGVWHAQIP